MNRFFLPPEQIVEGNVIFPDELSRKIRKVFHLNEKDAVIVLDNSGWEYLVQLDNTRNKQVTGHIMDKQVGRAEPVIKLSVAFSLAERDTIEWIIQKGTELGVARFFPYVSSLSSIKELKTNRARQEKLESIAREAAQQSMRSRLPELFSANIHEDMLKQTSGQALKLIAWEGTAIVQQISAEMLEPLAGQIERSLVLLVGPEGGFSAAEVALAEKYGFQQISFGNSILQMETACLAGSAILLNVGDRLLGRSNLKPR